MQRQNSSNSTSTTATTVNNAMNNNDATTANNGGQLEISLREAMQNLLTNDKLADISLRSTDGSIVRAQRCMLAARSDVFDRLLFGDFSEAQRNQVELGYSGEVIRAIVDYIYTDDAAVFDRPCDSKLVRTIVALADAANYYALPQLRHKADTLGISLMEANPLLAGEFLAACGLYGGAEPSTIEDFAMKVIRTNPKVLLEGRSVDSVGPVQLEKVMIDDNLDANEFTRFLILQKWANAASAEDDEQQEEDELTTRTRRTHTAMELTKHIHLQCIDPTNLRQTVRTSGLVTSDQLLDAYEAQAMFSQHRHEISFTKSRVPRWHNCKDVIFECQSDDYSVEWLQDFWVLKSGITKWSLQVQAYCYYVWVGVAANSSEIDPNVWLGRQAGGWVYGSNGAACHATGQDNGPYNVIHPRFTEGSIITLILDLTKSGGTLEASVDNGPFFQLFGGMLSEFKESSKGTLGFVPAVSLNPPGKVKFLGFERV